MRKAKQIALRFDTVVAQAIGKLPKSWYGFFSLVGLVVRPGAWILVLLLVSGGFLLRGESSFALIAFLAAVLIPMSTVMKLFFRRDRPVTIYTEAMKIKSYSFPSSHAYSAALACTVLTGLSFLVLAPWAGFITGVLGSVAIVVAVSRVFVGAHYPSDVTGGVVLGVLIGAVLFAVFSL